MASSSSAKKVARVAARSSGGSKATKQANWLFPAAIVAVVALGIGVLALARDRNAGSNDNDTPPRAQLAAGQPADHWHAAFAISVCGKELPALQDGATDPLGIHTHGDGLIHIHPFSVTSAGKKATMGKYFDQVGLKVTDDGFKMPGPDGAVYKEGETTCGGKPTELVLAHWKDGASAEGAKPDEIIRDGFSSVRFENDVTAFTLALRPKGSETVAAPSSIEEVTNPADVAGTEAPPTATVPPDSIVTTSTPEGSTPDGGSTTSAPSGSTTTSGSGG